MLKLLLFVTILHLAILAQACSEPGGCGKIDEPAAVRLPNANTQVTGECLHEINKREPRKTKIVAVVFVLSILAQLALYTHGSILSIILKILKLKSKSEIRATFPPALKHFNYEGDSKFRLKTILYVDKDIEYTNTFKNSFKEYFYGKTHQLDFSKPCETARSINNWVDCQICNPADDTIKPDAIHKGMGMALLNTFEVSVNLSSKSFPTCTKDMDFHKNEHQTIKVPAVHIRGLTKYGKIGNLADVHQISFDKHSLLMIKPNDINGMPSVLKKLRNHEDFNAVVNGLKYKYLSLTFPLIKTLGKHDFVECFQATRTLPELFFPHGAKFGNVFTNEDCVHISAMLQETSISVDEGLKKCDADLKGCPRSSDIPAHEIDQPFLFYILCEKNSPMVGGIWYGNSN